MEFQSFGVKNCGRTGKEIFILTNLKMNSFCKISTWTVCLVSPWQESKSQLFAFFLSCTLDCIYDVRLLPTVKDETDTKDQQQPGKVELKKKNHIVMLLQQFVIKKCCKTIVLSLHNIYLIVIIYVIFLFLEFYTEQRPTAAKYFQRKTTKSNPQTNKQDKCLVQ